MAADGCWFDTNSRLLFVGQLMSLKVTVFDLSEGFKLVGEFPALSSLGKGTNMLDDFTQDKIIVDQQDSVTEHEGRGIAKSNDYNNIALIGADWTGRSVMKFTLDGTVVQEIPLPQSVGELYEPTSVRWGSGYGFDSNSIYITEGGGFSGEESNRRVLQIPMYR